MQSEQLRDLIVAAIDEMKGRDMRVLDVRRMTDITDFMIIVSGTSDRHVRAVADKIRDTLREHGARPLGVEGERQGEWVLLDYGDVVVHVMHPHTRSFYDLERLWSEDMEHLVRLQREGRAE